MNYRIKHQKKTTCFAWIPGWCSTPTLLLICSSFSMENGHSLLICSSLSTAQIHLPSLKLTAKTPPKTPGLVQISFLLLGPLAYFQGFQLLVSGIRRTFHHPTRRTTTTESHTPRRVWIWVPVGLHPRDFFFLDSHRKDF